MRARAALHPFWSLRSPFFLQTKDQKKDQKINAADAARCASDATPQRPRPALVPRRLGIPRKTAPGAVASALAVAAQGSWGSYCTEDHPSSHSDAHCFLFRLLRAPPPTTCPSCEILVLQPPTLRAFLADTRTPPCPAACSPGHARSRSSPPTASTLIRPIPVLLSLSQPFSLVPVIGIAACRPLRLFSPPHLPHFSPSTLIPANSPISWTARFPSCILLSHR